MAKILHVCNWASGITTRNVTGLKQWSQHSHELVARMQHPYDMGYETATYTEASTPKEAVLMMAEEADILHFHAVGYDGTPGYPGTIHDIDWSQFRGKKLFIMHAMCSYVTPDEKTFERGNGDLFLIKNLNHYDALMGPHLSCKVSYEDRLKYVPDMIPINDWLYTPMSGMKQRIASTFKDGDVVAQCTAAGVPFRLFHTPTKMPQQLAWRRENCRVTMDNCRDGHWGLFGMESLSQGIPCATYIHPMNRECFDILGVPQPPFLPLEFAGKNAPETLRRIMDMPEQDWQVMSDSCRQWIESFYNERLLTRHWDRAYNEVLNHG